MRIDMGDASGMRRAVAFWACGICGCALVGGGCDDETTNSPTGTTSGTTSAGTATGSGSTTATGQGGEGTGASGQGGTVSQGGAAQGGQGTGGGCISCSDVWMNNADPADLCTSDGSPSSAAHWEAVTTCACDGTCAQCANNLCQDAQPSGACQGCVASDCSQEFADCVGP